jgi:hypothetical protein
VLCCDTAAGGGVGSGPGVGQMERDSSKRYSIGRKVGDALDWKGRYCLLTGTNYIASMYIVNIVYGMHAC